VVFSSLFTARSSLYACCSWLIPSTPSMAHLPAGRRCVVWLSCVSKHRDRSVNATTHHPRFSSSPPGLPPSVVHWARDLGRLFHPSVWITVVSSHEPADS
jgi:hypothetical protein